MTGNDALAWGMIAAVENERQASCFWARIPITPASDILHELSQATRTLACGPSKQKTRSQR